MPDIIKNIELDLSNVPQSDRETVKQEVGDFLVNKILENVAVGKSPVAGESFPKLDADYAKAQKGGDTTPNLELMGDMLSALTFQTTPSGVSVGIFSESGQEEKADGHNKFTGRTNNIPKRRFIPDSGQSFKSDIESEIQQIVSEFERQEPTPEVEDIFQAAQVRNISDETRQAISIDDLFSDDAIEAILRKLGR